MSKAKSTKDKNKSKEAVHVEHADSALTEAAKERLAKLQANQGYMLYLRTVQRKVEELETKANGAKPSRIRIQLNRHLTPAETEAIQTNHTVLGGRLNTPPFRGFRLRVSPNGEHIWVDANLPSRPLYDLIAEALAQHFVNVYPRAVRTFREYDGLLPPEWGRPL